MLTLPIDVLVHLAHHLAYALADLLHARLVVLVQLPDQLLNP